MPGAATGTTVPAALHAPRTVFGDAGCSILEWSDAFHSPYSFAWHGAHDADPAYPGATFQQGSTEVILPFTGAKPNIRRGSWILDATMTNPTGQAEPHGYFYRVVSVNDDTPGQLTLEIQTPAQANTFATVGGNTVNYGLAVVMDYVSEVFERKVLTKVIVPVP